MSDLVKNLRDFSDELRGKAASASGSALAEGYQVEASLVSDAADKIELLERHNHFFRGKLNIAEDAIKEAASRAHNRLATLQDMQPI